tara:strand:- start:9 stop:446 length:438 start_codon:yes stop_codon:yes gene_type:complete
MTVETTRFGTLEIRGEEIYTGSLFSVEGSHHFIRVWLEETNPFYWLQLIDPGYGHFAIPVVWVEDLVLDYSVELGELVDSKQVYVAATIPRVITESTIDLRNPIVIDDEAMTLRQVKVEGEDLPDALRFFDEDVDPIVAPSPDLN